MSDRSWDHTTLLWRDTKSSGKWFLLYLGVCVQLSLQPHHCVSPSTEVHSRVTPKGRPFLQVERHLAPIKFSHKPKAAFDQVVPCEVFQKEPETLVGIPDIPKHVRRPRKRIGAFHSQWIPFGDSDLIIRLTHRLCSQSTCKVIHTASVEEPRRMSVDNAIGKWEGNITHSV